MNELVTVFVLYIAIIIALVIFSNYYTKNFSDYILAGRNLSAPLTALGAGASDMSSWLLLALPGAIFTYGLNHIWIPISLLLGQYVNWQYVAKRLRIYTENLHALTIPAYLEKRFDDTSKILRLATAIIILIFFTFYTSSGFVSGGLLLKTSFHTSYDIGLLITAIIVMGYTCIGGFLAVSWIDFFQGILMFLSLLAVPLFTLHAIGGFDHTMDVITAEQTAKNISYINPFYNLSFITFISLFTWGLGYFGQPHILVRFMAINHHKHMSTAQYICMIWMLLSLIGATCTGFFSIAFFQNTSLQDAETVFLRLSTALFNPWIAGMLLAAVLSAMMSTASAQLLASSSTLVEDFYHRFFRPKASQKELLFMSRLGVIIISLIALFIAHDPKRSILHLVSYAWAGLGASFGPVVLISLFWKKMSLLGAISGLISGSATVLLWPLIQHVLDIQIYSLFPAFMISCFTIFAVSRFKEAGTKLQKEFDMMITTLKS